VLQAVTVCKKYGLYDKAYAVFHRLVVNRKDRVSECSELKTLFISFLCQHPGSFFSPRNVLSRIDDETIRVLAVHFSRMEEVCTTLSAKLS